MVRSYARDLRYAPLPADIVKRAEAKINSITADGEAAEIAHCKFLHECTRKRRKYRTLSATFATWRRRFRRRETPATHFSHTDVVLLRLFVVGIVVAMVVALATDSMLSIRQFGFSFLTSQHWNPIKGRVWRVAVYLRHCHVVADRASDQRATLFGYRIFLVEQAPYYIARPVGFLVELLAAIPSVVYGLWGIFVLAPFLRVYVDRPWRDGLAGLPFFRDPITGIGLLTGGIILAIMVTPIISAVVRDVLAAVPGSQREAALALGCNEVGNDSRGSSERCAGNCRGGDSWAWTGAWRNDGGDDGDRQPAADQSLAFRSVVHDCFGHRE